MSYLFQLLGSLRIAVPLLVTIAGVLGWGTIYESLCGTAAVQRFIYRSWWFQVLLAFLAVNLAVAALQRYPWKRRHIPFVLAHIGIILTLIGGIIGGKFGVEGQLIIPEGETSSQLQLPGNVLVVHHPQEGFHQVFPTRFDSTAWIHEPNTSFPLLLGDRPAQLIVDRYYPNSRTEEIVTDEGREENPAIHLALKEGPQEDEMWLFSREPNRFGARWGNVHLLFLEPESKEQLARILGDARAESERGIVSLRFPDDSKAREFPVPAEMNQAIQIPGTSYQITFKEYFSDFAITEQGPVNRSDQPNNPAVAFTLSGPEGTDAHLLFALHPDFQALHSLEHKIEVEMGYAHPAGAILPPNSSALVRMPSGKLAAIFTGEAGQRTTIDPLEVGRSYDHPWTGSAFEVTAFYPRAQLHQHLNNIDNEVKGEAIHVVGRDGPNTAQAWLRSRENQELRIGDEKVIVEYGPAQKELPFAVKLLDFRRIDYPGIQMAAAFQSDVELSDPERGLVMKRTISMNNPLKYRGFTLFQSSYIQGPVEATVLSVRNDPGTPLVYTGFIIIVLGVVTMFIFRKPSDLSDAPSGPVEESSSPATEELEPAGAAR